MAATTHVGFRNRPIDPASAISAQISKSLRLGRSYQRQHITSTGAYVISGSVTSGSFTSAYSIVPFLPGDVVVSAVVIVAWFTGGTYDIEINGTLRGGALNGPWAGGPNTIDIQAFAVPAVDSPASGRLFVRMKNVGGGTFSNIEFQTVITVLR